MFIARQRLCEHIPTAMNTQATINQLPLLYNDAVNTPSHAWFVQSCYKEEFRSWQ
jgi:hypothetical protein